MGAAVSKLVQISVADGVAHVVLDRPARRNAVVPEMLDQLRERLQEVEASTNVRVLVLEGAGSDFCIGVDLAARPATYDEEGAESEKLRLRAEAVEILARL